MRASTPIAAKVTIWNEEAKEGRGLRIPVGAEFVIGGDFPRIELIGLTESLRAHTSFKLLLVFEKAGKISVDVVVESGSKVKQ
jgi:copper(I)-binding protein